MRAEHDHPSTLRLLAGQIGYQLRILVRSRVSVFFVFVLPVMLILALDLLHGNGTISSRGGIRFNRFLAPAVMAFAVINGCYAITITTAALAREQGILKRLRGTPLPPWIYIAGRVVSAAALSLAAVLAVAVLSAAVYGVPIPWGQMPAILLTLAIGLASFTALGFAVASRVPSADAAFPTAWGTLLPVAFVSDIFMPLDHGPEWLRTLASALPVKPFADSLEDAFNPTVAHAMPWGHLAIIAAWGLGAALLAPRVFQWEHRAPRRTRVRAAP